MKRRIVFFAGTIAVGLAAVAWAVLRVQLPPAEFSFVNATELKALDPHVVTGVPEHRVLSSVYEGLSRLDPRTCEPVPGVAREWKISDDGRVYTFLLRENARWSNGDRVTAHDFVYSYQRFLNPLTAAEYSYQAWYIKNARRYSAASEGFGRGDPVEVELNEPLEGALPFARGEIVYGKLISVSGEGDGRVFVVNVDGVDRRYSVNVTRLSSAVWPCKQVLLDFREVGVRAIDDLTLEVTLENPTSYWPSLAAYHAVLPVNKTCVETYGTPEWTLPENIVTNGAYRVAARRIRDRIRLVKSDTYWDRDNVFLNSIDVLAVESMVTMFNLYETGKVDWITDPPPIVLREFMKPGNERVDFKPEPYLSTYYYLINTNRKPLDDVRVRRALALSIDRGEITRTALASGERPIYSLVPPVMPNYDSPEFGREDPAEARRLLAEAGYPDGRGFPKLDILFNTHEAHKSIAELIRKQWERNLGIVVSTRNEEWASYLNSLRQFEFSVARRGWVGDYIDPNTYLDMMVTDGGNNNTGWSNAKYDELIAAAAKENDADKRREMLHSAERILMDELPIIPIYYYVDRNMVKPYVRGFYGNLLDTHPLSHISIDHEARAAYEASRK